MPRVANYILNDLLSTYVSSLAVIECYIHHIPSHLLPAPRKTLLQRVGTAKSLLKTIVADASILLPNARSEADAFLRAGCIG